MFINLYNLLSYVENLCMFYFTLSIVFVHRKIQWVCIVVLKELKIQIKDFFFLQQGYNTIRR